MTKRFKLLISLAGLLIFAVYAWSAARTVTMEDSGEFLVMVDHLGIAHPPGYPLYILLGKLFTYLPWGSVAFKIHLFSGLCGALCCVLVGAITFHFNRNWIPALFAAFLLGFGRLLWSQSVIAEIYALSGALLLSTVWLSLILQKRLNRSGLFTLGLLVGFNLATSWPLFGLCAPAFLCLWWPAKEQRKNLIRLSWLFLPGLLLGLMPYLFLYWRSFHGLTLSFYGPISSFGELVDYILRKAYAADDAQATASLSDALAYHLYFLKNLFWEFTPLALLPALMGAGVLVRKTTRLNSLAFLLIFLSTSVFLLFKWRVQSSSMGEEIYRVFHIAPFAVVAVVSGLGLDCLLAQRPKLRPLWLALAVVVVLLNLLTHLRENNYRSDTFASDYAKMVLDWLPPDSVLLTWGDVDAGAFAYAHESEGRRADVTVTSQFGTLFPLRFFRPGDSGRIKANRLLEFVSETLKSGKRVFASQPLFLFQVFPSLPFSTRHYGAVTEVVQGPGGFAADRALSSAALEIFEKASGYQYSWQYLRAQLWQRLCHTLLLNSHSHPLLDQEPACQLIQAEHLFALRAWPKADSLFRTLAESQSHVPFADQLRIMRGLVDNRLHWIESLTPASQMAELRKLTDEALPFIQRYPICENSVAVQLLKVRKQVPVPLDLGFFNRQFGRCGAGLTRLLREVK